jgi:hypothetical protein
MLLGLHCLQIGAQDRVGRVIPFAFSKEPTNCETNAVKFDSYVKQFRTLPNGNNPVLIAIAHLGSGERSVTLNGSRLYIVRATLIEDLGLREQDVVTAEGPQVKGYGRVDLYLEGRLVDSLLVNRGRALCADCCHPEGRKYLYPDQPKRKVE